MLIVESIFHMQSNSVSLQTVQISLQTLKSRLG